MNLLDGMSVNEKGHLTLGGCDSVALAEKYGTPLYVLDESVVRDRCRSLKAAVTKYFPNGRIMYASKALNTKAVLKIVSSEGLGVDTVSLGEMFTALSAGISPDKIELHGNSKTREEIAFALQNHISCIIADGFDELEMIEEECQRQNASVNVSIRLRPSIDVHAHTAMQTARMDCKFGFGIIDAQAIRAAEIIANSKFMKLYGIHCHIGSQIFEEEPFAQLCKSLTEFALLVREKTGVTVSEFNCGGGYGVKYNDEDEPKPFEVFIKTIYDSLRLWCNELSFPMPNITIEPGRSVVGEAGTTLYTVNGVKKIEGVRTYVMCDGGMFENVRTALYDAKYTCVCASKMNEAHTQLASVAGKCCESGDMITYDSHLPEVKRGDILAVMTTGAYNYSMASNYNRNLIPAMALVADGRDFTAVKRQSLEYITALDEIPEHLR